MLVKKLRESRNWSQEQLATMAGLNIRTVQRIESGNRASIESLKSLAAVFEVSTEELRNVVVTIDKYSSKWKSLPFIFRLNFFGSSIGWLGLSQRKYWVKGEKQVAIFGSVLIALGLIDPAFIVAGLLMLAIAYYLSLVLRFGDRYSVW